MVTARGLPEEPLKGRQSLGINPTVLEVTLATPLPSGASAGAGARAGLGEGRSETAKTVDGAGAGDGSSMPGIAA